MRCRLIPREAFDLLRCWFLVLLLCVVGAKGLSILLLCDLLLVCFICSVGAVVCCVTLMFRPVKGDTVVHFTCGTVVGAVTECAQHVCSGLT
jgi:hypothetical protein